MANRQPQQLTCEEKEDLGRPLTSLVLELLWFRQRTQSLNLTIPFFFHAGETLGSGNDTDLNLFDAMVLPDNRRIGHGFSFLHHPLPAMIAHGVPTSISNDDPAIVGRDSLGLSFDFY